MNAIARLITSVQNMSLSQWLTIVWVLGLNSAPFIVAVLKGGSLATIHWVAWSLLSGPFALTAMLTFQLVAGGLPPATRRLIFTFWFLLMVGTSMLLFNKEIFGAILLFLTEAIVLLPATLLTCWLFHLPAPPQKWSLQFSIAEILWSSGLVGVFLFMARVSGAYEQSFWLSEDIVIFVVFAVITGIYLLPCCLATVANRSSRIAWLVVTTVLLWLAYPAALWGILWLFDQAGSGDGRLLLLLLYPVHGVQALIVWGTLFPLRIYFPGFLHVTDSSPLSSPLCKSDTPDDALASYPQSEHTDVLG